jgi:hypothetical protein
MTLILMIQNGGMDLLHRTEDMRELIIVLQIFIEDDPIQLIGYKNGKFLEMEDLHFN